MAPEIIPAAPDIALFIALGMEEIIPDTIEGKHRTPLASVDSLFKLPEILSQIILKNCDEDGVPDGFTDFNLDQANDIITYGATGTTVTYYFTFLDANAGSNPINPSPYNNLNGNIAHSESKAFPLSQDSDLESKDAGQLGASP